MTDAALIDRQIAAAWSECAQGLLRYASFHTRQDPQDLVQDVFFRFTRELQRGVVIENAHHWMFRVARNLAIDRAKRFKRRAPRECELSHEMCDVIADPRPTPEQSLVAATRAAQVRRAVEGLTPLQQRCVQLRAEGYMLREIAELLDSDIRRVAEAIQRAVRNIQKAVEAPTTRAARRAG